MKQSKFGFTLVELLIVIALLGALAVGLLAALDPFEQLKKGTDTGIRNTTSEIQGAAIRYYAIKGYMPWCASITDCSGGDPSSGKLADDLIVRSAIENMKAAGELKTNFIELAEAYSSKIFLTGDSSDDSPSLKVCFMPQSKAFKADPNTKYERDGEVHLDFANTCVGHIAGATYPCYWCVM